MLAAGGGVMAGDIVVLSIPSSASSTTRSTHFPHHPTYCAHGSQIQPGRCVLASPFPRHVQCTDRLATMVCGDVAVATTSSPLRLHLQCRIYWTQQLSLTPPNHGNGALKAMVGMHGTVHVHMQTFGGLPRDSRCPFLASLPCAAYVIALLVGGAHHHT